jgi:multidrug efflux pump subunit AcrB
MLEIALKKPKLTVAMVGLLFGVSCLLVPMLGTEFFPVGDYGQFVVRMRAETGSRIEFTTQRVEAVSKRIEQLLPKDSVDTVLANTGVLPSWAAAYSANSASHDSLLQVEMKEGAGVGAESAIRVLRPALSQEFPDLHFSYSIIDPVSSALNFGSLNPVDIRVEGPNLAEGQRIARELLSKVQGVPGITDAGIEQTLGYPAIHIDVNRIKAGYLGLAADEVIKDIVTALNSSVLFALNFWDDPATGNNYFIGAQYPESQIDSKQTISNIPVGSAKIGSTLLRNVAALTDEKIPVEISHDNLLRTFDVQASVVGRDIGSVASQIDRIVRDLKLPKRYMVRWGGSVQAMRASFGNMGVGMALSLVLIFLLMVAQLKSFIDPLLIMATVPLGFIGVIWILFLTNTTINIQSIMGVIMLIGIVVSNSVILADFANQRMAAGHGPVEAMREAGVTRLRPILMTAISTVIALIPSALGGANAPLARAVIGGLLTATFLTLTFLPAIYVLTKSKNAAS